MEYDSGQTVRLKANVPHLGLRAGQIGVVCARWFEPLDYYEVEFPSLTNHVKVRVVLEQTQLIPMERTEPLVTVAG